MRNTTQCILLMSILSVLAFGCDDNPATPDGGGTDTGPSAATACETYCDTVATNCSGDNANYADRAECLDVCASAGWPEGDPVTASGPASGNTVGCRTYHSGAPAVDDPATHCPHSGETGANVCGTWCDVYCGTAMSVCTGANALYANTAACMTACGAFDTTGEIGVTSGDTVQCRLYHLGVAIRGDDTAMHCPHAGADGAGVCVGPWTFRTDDPSDYTRVDRMGMPAVSTALVSSAQKNAYNDADPSNDAAGDFVAELSANLTALHAALDDDLTGLSLVPCATAACLAQEVAPGVTVANLVVPDTLTVSTGAPSGFPNGRGLTDPVMDVTLAVILLDLTATGQTPATLAGVPVNPTANDMTFDTEFPFLAAPHAP